MKEYYGIGDDSWRQCIPGCVPPQSAANPIRVQVGVKPVRFSGAGALVPWKRWELMLEALAATSIEARDHLRFAHIGGVDGTAASSRYSTFLRTRTKELGLEANVTWLGEQASSQAFLGETDCLVITSEREPFSIAMLEALAAGLPVLAADSGGAKDVIVPPKNGWLFRSGDVNDLAAHLEKLSKDGIVFRPEVRSSKPKDLSRAPSLPNGSTPIRLY